MQSIFSAFALHLFIWTCEPPIQPKAVENRSKEHVIALFEQEEKKRETVDVKLRARL